MPHRLFIPRKKKRSKILSLGSLLFINVFLLCLVFLRLFSTNVKDFSILGFATNIKINDIFRETNAQRAASNLPDLKYSVALSRAAEKKAYDMFAQNYWSHIAPNGKTPWDFIIGENYKYTYAGENLAKDFQKSSSVVKAWMNSPSHRENILNSHYTEVGFAVVNGTLQGKETTLVVQMFGTPYINTSEDLLNTNEAISTLTEAAVNSASSINNLESESQTNHQTNFVSTNTPLNINLIEPDNKNLIVLRVDIIKYISYGVLSILALALFVDGFLAYKHKYLRVTGNTLSHIILFVLTLMFIYYLSSPEII